MPVRPRAPGRVHRARGRRRRRASGRNCAAWRAPGNGPCPGYPASLRMSDARADFPARAEGGGMVPLLREGGLDGDTPLGAFVKVARPPVPFLLQSVVGGRASARAPF